MKNSWSKKHVFKTVKTCADFLLIKFLRRGDDRSCREEALQKHGEAKERDYYSNIERGQEKVSFVSLEGPHKRQEEGAQRRRSRNSGGQGEGRFDPKQTDW